MNKILFLVIKNEKSIIFSQVDFKQIFDEIEAEEEERENQQQQQKLQMQQLK